MAAIDIVNRVFREFKRYTGDGLPGAPSGAPLPVGDPQSGVHNPKKSDIRTAFGEVLGAAYDGAEAAEEALAELERLYLGAKTTDPTVDNAGGVLEVGALYFNTTVGKFRVWNGSVWQDQSTAIADGEVTTAKLADHSVTAEKLPEDPGELDAIRVIIGAASHVSTSVARSISGLVPFNSAAAPATRIGVSPGSARDKDNTVDIVLLTGIEKRVDQVFSIGNHNGGRDVAAAFAPGTGVHIFLIWNPDTEMTEVLLSQSAANPVMPSGFTKRRRIGCLMLDASAQPYAGIWYANGDFFYKSPIYQGFVSAATTALLTTMVPLGVKMQTHCVIVPDDTGAGNPAFGVIFSDPDLGPPPGNNLGWVVIWKVAGGTGVGLVTAWTDTAARVYAGGTFSRATSVNSYYQRGWTDLRDEFV